MNGLLDAALGYAQRAWPVFPCAPRGKVPAVPGGQGCRDATTDPDRIAAWWHTYPAANIGVAAGPAAGFFVVDVDDLDGLTQLTATHGPLPATLTARTGSGGLHLLFTYPPAGDIGNRAKFAPGLDVRGAGGYIVAAPSIHPNGQPYAWTDQQPIADPPAWLLTLLTARPAPIPLAGDLAGEDPWGRRVLEGEAAALLAAAEGQRNDTLFRAALKVFGAVKGDHLDHGRGWDTLRNAAHGVGLRPREVETTLESAWTRADPRHPEQRSLAALPVPAPQLEDIPLPEAPPDGTPAPLETGGRQLRVLTRDELDSIPPPAWQIDSLFTTGFTVLYGPSGAGKSFVALDWALSVATGHPWFGKPAIRATAVYIAAEGTSGIPRRVHAWEADRRERAVDFVLIPETVNLLNPADVSLLDHEVGARDAGLLVVDTLARSMPGGDENAAQDMGRLIDAVTGIQSRRGCAVLLIHHTGVEGRRPRGSTALFGAADTVIRCDGADGHIQVTCDKQKDDDPFTPWSLRMKPTGESVALTLAGGRHASDVAGYALAALAAKAPQTFPELTQLVGGDAQLADRMVADGRVARTAGGDGALYTTPAKAVTSWDDF